MRDLEENAGPVAGIGFAAAGAAMAKVQENRQCLMDDLMRSFAFDIDDKTHTAAVFFVCGVIETLLGRKPWFDHA